MRFALPLVAIAAAFGLASASPALETRQEAARFGALSVDPQTVKIGEVCTFTCI